MFLSLSLSLCPSVPPISTCPPLHTSISLFLTNTHTRTHLPLWSHNLESFETPGLAVYETRERDQVQACLRCGRERLSPTASPGLESSALLSPHLLLVRRPLTSAKDGSSYVVSFLHHEGRNGTDYGRDEECTGKERRGFRRRKL